jgi:hypothetical protein
MNLMFLFGEFLYSDAGLKILKLVFVMFLELNSNKIHIENAMTNPHISHTIAPASDSTLLSA